MTVKILNEFFQKLTVQADYIARDKPYAAQKFEIEVLELVNGLGLIPYQNRKSIHYKDENIRDLIFKGYKIIYRVKPNENIIEVFGFMNYQEKP